MIKQFYLQQFNLVCHLFALSYLGRYQVLQLRATVDLGVMAMRVYSAFPKAPLLLEPLHQIV